MRQKVVIDRTDSRVRTKNKERVLFNPRKISLSDAFRVVDNCDELPRRFREELI